MLINITKRRRTIYDQLRLYSLNITIMATMLLLFVFLGATTYLYMHSETTFDNQNAKRENIEQKATSSEWMRINKKQGYPLAVTKAEEEMSFFQDKQSRE